MYRLNKYKKELYKIARTLRWVLRDLYLQLKRKGPLTIDRSKKFSIIIPTLSKGSQLNHLPTLKRLLKDYLPRQAYQNYEAIVYCDGPNEQVSKMVSRLKDPRIKLYWTDETLGLWGHPQTRLGIQCATGDYFLRMNDDNKPNKKYLEILAEGFEKSQASIVYGRVIFSGQARLRHRGVLKH